MNGPRSSARAGVKHYESLSLLNVGARGLGHDRVLVHRVGHGRELAVDVEEDDEAHEHHGHDEHLRVRCVSVAATAYAIDATVNQWQ